MTVWRPISTPPELMQKTCRPDACFDRPFRLPAIARRQAVFRHIRTPDNRLTCSSKSISIAAYGIRCAHYMIISPTPSSPSSAISVVA
jgi:hypothetical protein